jgi:hypothetical protein
MSTDGGQTFGSDITVQNVTFVQGSLNGNLTTFSFPAMDADITQGPHHGNLYIAYTDDAPGYTDTDVFFTRSTDGGTSWSTKVRLNDDTQNNGCDQFHPWLVVAPDGSVIVVWLDRRLDPNNLYMDLYMTCSTDGGTTWMPNERISTVSSDPTAGDLSMLDSQPLSKDQPIICAGRAGLIGEYIGLTASSIDDIHPLWTDTRLGDQDAFFAIRDSSSPAIGEMNDRTATPLFFLSPNPADGRCIIYLDPQLLSHGARLAIYDVQGRTITQFPKLSSVIIWDCVSETKTSVGAGVYFCRYSDGSRTLSKTLVLF